MKSTLFLSLIIAVFTLTACDNENNTDTMVSEQLEGANAKISNSTTNMADLVGKKSAEMSQTAEENTEDATEIIKENLESIEENWESNP